MTRSKQIRCGFAMGVSSASGRKRGPRLCGSQKEEIDCRTLDQGARNLYTLRLGSAQTSCRRSIFRTVRGSARKMSWRETGKSGIHRGDPKGCTRARLVFWEAVIIPLSSLFADEIVKLV